MATMKQKSVMSKILGNPGKTITSAMREAGYSENTLNTPSYLTKSKSWLELLDIYMPEELLTKVGYEGLESTRTISAVSGKQAGGADTDFIEVPDFAVRHKYYETGLKLRKKLSDKIEQDIKMDFGDLTDDKLDEVIKQKSREVGAIEATPGEEASN